MAQKLSQISPRNHVDFGPLQTILLFIVWELVVGGSVAVSVGVSDK